MSVTLMFGDLLITTRRPSASVAHIDIEMLVCIAIHNLISTIAGKYAVTATTVGV
jgi:hypothetical protein